MSEAREYIVVLKDKVDLDNFYDDMESSYCNEHIPDRQVELAYRRPSSRSTHYYLTDNEAAKLASDPRVESLTLTYQERGLKITPMVVQTSSRWSKSGTVNANDLNWGLLRGYESANRSNWGSDGTPEVSGSINLTNVGNNVDVVIIDGHLIPNHPEWAKKLDGSGGTRLNQYNWFIHRPVVTGQSAGTYIYDLQVNGDTQHGNNVAGIAAGSSCGWARGANIYNISPYGSHINDTPSWFYDHISYVRAWHNSKPINVKTGRKNPTICNMSYGLASNAYLPYVTEIQYQGVVYPQPPGGWTVYDRIYFGLIGENPPGFMLFMARDPSIDAEIVDGINDGIIFVGAAGNNIMYIDEPSGPNYDNYLRIFGTERYYMRGPSPGAAPGVICVSNIDSVVAESKNFSSCAGPRTDIFAPGTNIMGAYQTGGVNDPRASTFKKGKMTGTSQASPQICGLLACALETYPSMTAAEARTYIQNYAFQNVLPGGGTFDTSYGNYSYLYYTGLYGGPNLYSKYYPERPVTGLTKPKINYKIRGTEGRTYPRTIIRRYG